ncbi:MAG: DUF4835 family protein [Weeksellaceae bacterium]|jgi:hypothetical protein|nr:DUF4835 family protein [Weeksellaceae bacterium]MDX9704209.1 DUF4835 family protein [Weeksellaceae bacterium]
MSKMKVLLMILLTSVLVSAQEFRATVTVDYSQVQTSNNQIFKTLERSLNDFVNTTKWTDNRLKVHEKIEANFLIIVTGREGNNFQARLQIQSRRPVFNTTYYTPILNFVDSKFDFTYTESEDIVFNPRKFSDKNLSDVIAFYVYYILGMDADTFKLEGGTPYFKISQQIANNAVGARFSGWSEMEGNKSRSSLINDVLKANNKALRNVYYQYHRVGLDMMDDNETRAKNVIGNALETLNFYSRGNYALFYPLDIFFLAKKDEIGKIFGGGMMSSVNITQIKETLNSLSPTNSSIWNNLKK